MLGLVVSVFAKKIFFLRIENEHNNYAHKTFFFGICFFVFLFVVLMLSKNTYDIILSKANKNVSFLKHFLSG